VTITLLDTMLYSAVLLIGWEVLKLMCEIIADAYFGWSTKRRIKRVRQWRDRE
jgi:hypothetical protein